MEGGAGIPDLQTILATLAQQTPVNSNVKPVDPRCDGSPTPEIPEAELQAVFSQASQEAQSQKASQDPRLKASIQSQDRSNATASPRPMIDPSTITVWSEALKCVTKIAAQNAQFAVSIKRMIKDQRAHEIRWYTERQNLKQTQANRSTSAAKAQSILKQLNTSFYGSPPAPPVEVDAKAEMEAFDRKIYQAQVEMDAAMSAELKGLGVPFFGTQGGLVVKDGNEGKGVEKAKWSVVVTEGELLELRRKMVQHLEDLYRE